MSQDIIHNAYMKHRQENQPKTGESKTWLTFLLEDLVQKKMRDSFIH